MTGSQRRYVAIETLISCIINGIFSLFFSWLIFASAPTASVGDVAFDALPQSIVIAFMATLVPTLLTRSRLAKRRIDGIVGRRVRRWPVAAVARAALIAATVGVAGGIATILLLPRVAAPEWAFADIAAYKVLYGVMLSGLVTVVMVRVALSDPHPPIPA
ncbi:MAG TPA: hypothetical protein VFO80_08120 [Sphingomonas sp.]|nr:hypothetical protein [Sphingomonas sp.]